MAVFDIISTATNAANSAKNTLTESSLAKDLSAGLAKNSAQIQSASNQIVGKLKDSIRDPLGAFNVDLKGLLKTPSMIGATVPSDALPPYPNSLGIFASYTYIITLSVLDDKSLNNPDSTYRSGIPQYIICKSAAGDPTNRVKTDYGQFDFFIDNLNIDSVIGWNKATKNTNATTLDFQVIEPYSMGLFMQSVAIACQQRSPGGTFISVPMLLTIQFRGFTEQNETVDIPQFTRYQPIKLNTIDMKVTGKGAVYSISATSWNDAAFSDRYKNLKTNISVKGKTVQEVLQTGEKSLQVVMNQFYQAQVKSGLTKVPDQIAIVFPTDVASSSSTANPNPKENNSSATANPTTAAANNTLFQKLGVTETSTKNLVQAPESCNVLGRASLGFNAERKGDSSFAKEAGSYDPKTKTVTLGNVVIDPAEGEFKFRQDTDVINAINQVLLQSDYARQAIKGDNIDPTGMLPWWRIETQLYQLTSDANLAISGTKPSLIVYRIVPYKVHSGKIMPPNTPAPGFENLKRQCIKEYNYIYTGKNLDILDFNISINAGFYTKFSATGFNSNQDVKTQANTGAADADETKGIGIDKPEGEKTVVTGSTGSKVLAVGTSTSTDKQGGGGAETVSTRVARQFHEAVTEGADMMTAELKIMGDPYYINDSGQGNYTAPPTNYQNLNANGTVNYQSGEVDIILNFRTPVDINQSAGMYDFGDTKLLINFSGIFQVMTVKHSFSSGKFTQVLNLNRRGLQEAAAANKAAGINTASKMPSAEPTVIPAQVPSISSTNLNILNTLTGKNNNVNTSTKTPALPGVINTGGVNI